MIRDNEHPFFRPLWIRVLIVAICVAWSMFEFWTEAPFWGVLALGFAGYGVWQFFLNYNPPPKEPASIDPTKE